MMDVSFDRFKAPDDYPRNYPYRPDEDEDTRFDDMMDEQQQFDSMEGTDHEH